MTAIAAYGNQHPAQSRITSIQELDSMIENAKSSSKKDSQGSQVFDGSSNSQEVQEHSNSSLGVFTGVGVPKVLQSLLNNAVSSVSKADDLLPMALKTHSDDLVVSLATKRTEAVGTAKFLGSVLKPTLGETKGLSGVLNYADDALSATAKGSGALANAAGKGAAATQVLKGLPIVGPAIQFGVGLMTGQSIAESGTRTATSTVGAAIGQTLIPIPIVGAVIGGLVGDWVGSKGYDWFKNNLV